MESSVRAQPRIQVTVYICCEMSLAVPLGLGNFCLAGPFTALPVSHVLGRAFQALIPLRIAGSHCGCRIPRWAGLGTVPDCP